MDKIIEELLSKCTASLSVSKLKDPAPFCIPKTLTHVWDVINAGFLGPLLFRGGHTYYYSQIKKEKIHLYMLSQIQVATHLSKHSRRPFQLLAYHVQLFWRTDPHFNHTSYGSHTTQHIDA